MSRFRASYSGVGLAHWHALREAAQSNFGSMPNTLRIVANSPAAFGAFLGFSGALSNGALSALPWPWLT